MTYTSDRTLLCQATLLARTVPEETSNGDITVCSAWWAPALGGLIRIYPLDMRAGMKAWRRYELVLPKGKKAPRWRSNKTGGPAEPVARPGREALYEPLSASADGTTIVGLNRRRDSMGVIRPITLR